jgi:hypothetical protein
MGARRIALAGLRVSRPFLVPVFLRICRWFGSRDQAIRFARRARGSLMQEQWSGAIYFGRLAVATDPTYAHGYRLLAFAYLRNGQHQKARQVYEQGARIGHADPDLRFTCDNEAAWEAYKRAPNPTKRALELEPESPERRPPRSILLRTQVRVALGIALLRRLIRR